MTQGSPIRLKFADFDLQHLAGSRCRARVTLTWPDGEEHVAEAEGLSSQAGELRCAAEACVSALGKSVKGTLRFELIGVKAVRAFDANVIIVSLEAREGGDGQRVVGCFLSQTDAPRGAALAVLNATNRILDNRLFMR